MGPVSDADRDIEVIEPADLHEVWEDVRASLVRVLKKSPARWLPEDIYTAIRANTATLYVVKENGCFIGCFVLQLRAEFDGPVVFCWIAEGKFLFEWALNHVKEIARGRGAKRIEFRSPRRGWTRYAQAVETIYEVPLWADQAVAVAAPPQR
jgi:hypothetical protein